MVWAFDPARSVLDVFWVFNRLVVALSVGR